MKKFMNLFYLFFSRILYRLKNKTKISVTAYCDSRCVFGRNNYVGRLCVMHNVQMGDYSYIANNSSAHDSKIGKFCSIAADVKIGVPKHPIDMVSTSPVFYNTSNKMGIKWARNHLFSSESPNTYIGNDVWIGSNVIIMSGLKIGDGAVIGAGAVVTKDVEPYTVVVGIPAAPVRKRFSEDVVKDLLQMNWWDWNSEKLKENVDNFAEPTKLIYVIKNANEQSEQQK